MRRSRSARRVQGLVFPLLVGAWCTAWAWLVLALTSSLPGIFTGEPGRGASELLEVSTGLPCRTLLGMLFLASMLPCLLLQALRVPCDGHGRVLAAMLWPLRAVGFRLPVFLWLAATLALLVLAPVSASWILPLAAVVGASLAPFFCWNPALLDAPSASRWWKPGGAGLRQVAWWIVLLLLIGLCGLLFGIAMEVSGIALGLAWTVLDELLSSFILLLAALIWLAGGVWGRAKQDLIAALRVGLAGEYVWLSLVKIWLLLVLALPGLLIVAANIYLTPQYDAWLRQSGDVLPFGLWLLSGMGRDSGVWSGLLVPFGLYWNLVVGRLLREHGVGRVAASA